MPRAFITGISGFVGSHLAEYLLANTQWDIVGMIRWRSPLENMKGFLGHARVRFVYADLRDTLAVQRAVREADPDYVFHLAAQSFPQTSYGSPLDTIDTNTNGTVRLLEAILETTPHAVVHVCSSSEVYGRARIVPIGEDAPFHPTSPYAISKVGADLAGRYYAEAHGMNVQVTRMFTHSGPRRGDVYHESSFAKQIAMIETGLIPPIVKVGNLDSVRTYADVRDAVRAYYLAVTHDPLPGAVYNIGGSNTCQVGDTLDALLRLANCEAEIEVDPDRLRPIDADNQVPDCSRFKVHTGWEPKIDFAETLTDLLAYWRKRVAAGEAVMQR